MSTSRQDNYGTLYPSLFYRDARRAQEWLGKAFGHEVLMSVPGAKNGVIEHSELRLGDGIIMVGTATEDRAMRSPLDLAGLNQGLYVYTEDVDALFARARAAGAVIEQEPQDQDYGGRTCGFRDLEGHRWWFGSYRPGSPGP